MNLSIFRLIYLLSLILTCPALIAQTIQEIKSDTKTYLWGEGTGSTLREADQMALSDIISQISTQVESNFIRTITETGNKFTEKVNDVVKTYSNATLSNTQRIIIQHEPDAKVFRFLKRSEIAKVFESRKQKIIEFARNGEQAVSKLQIADALRYFYWSQTLLRSHPEGAEIKMTSDQGLEVLLITWLPVQINNIFSYLTIKIEKVENRKTYNEYLLDMRYNQKPVRNLDYSYWSGQDWTNMFSAKDGLGIAELPTINNVNEIRFKIEYAFEGESAIDMELRDVMQQLPQVPYRNAYINAATNPGTNTIAQPKPVSGNNSNDTVLASTTEDQGKHNTIKPLTQIKGYEDILQKILNAIVSKNYASVKSFFTTEGYSIFLKLIQYGNAKILKSGNLRYFKHGNDVMCRSVPMSFSFNNNRRTFVEDVVFTFDSKNKVSNITFALSRQSVDDIASNQFWSENTRLLLINFMENYKTAYALKRLDYIESIFSDNALIITGSVVKATQNREFQYTNNQIIKYNKLSKEQYMRNLRHCFQSNEFINIRFADNIVRQSGKGNEVYGIQIKQDYFSSNYGDRGYLFLLIDMTDSISPVIHVRTWQPEKNPDGSIYGLSDF